MRFDGPGSSNFEDRTGGGGGLNLGGGLGMILSLVASRFGIVGILVLLLGYCALSSLGGGGILGGGSGGGTGKSTLPAEQSNFLRQVLGSTEQVWGQIFQQAGSQYRPTTLVAYTNYDQSGCGAAQAAMGPFYCPTDQQIYIDPVFFEELSRRSARPATSPKPMSSRTRSGTTSRISKARWTRPSRRRRVLARRKATRSRSVSNFRPIAMPASGPLAPARLRPAILRKACAPPKRSATTC